MVRPHKYRAKPTVVDGIRFASMKESSRYRELTMLERAGNISDLQIQPEFVLLTWNPHIKQACAVGKYRADFSYTECLSGAWVVEDVKGFRTPVYKLKKKMVEATYGITIREV